MNYKNLFKKWKCFGWNTILCDGHDIKSIIKASQRKIIKSFVIICKTTKGKGVKFAENNNDWHHGRLTKIYLENSNE